MEEINIDDKYRDLFSYLRSQYLKSTGGEDFSSSIKNFIKEDNINLTLKLYNKIYNNDSFFLDYKHEIQINSFFNDAIYIHVKNNKDTPLEYIKIAIVNLRDVSNKEQIFKYLENIVLERYEEKYNQFKEDIHKFRSLQKKFSLSKRKLECFDTDSNGYNLTNKTAKKQFGELLKMGYYPSKKEKELFRSKWFTESFKRKNKFEKIIYIILGIAVLICIIFIISKESRILNPIHQESW